MNIIVRFIAKKYFPIWYAKKIGVTLGKGCRLINVSYSTEPYLITLGNHVSVTFSHFETHDGGVWVIRDKLPRLDVVGSIVVGDNVFVGYGCVILPGARIGDNVVIGARSVVKGIIPSNVVVAGAPARVIKKLDEYADKCVADGDLTADLSPDEKRSFYIKKLLSRQLNRDSDIIYE